MEDFREHTFMGAGLVLRVHPDAGNPGSSGVLNFESKAPLTRKPPPPPFPVRFELKVEVIPERH